VPEDRGRIVTAFLESFFRRYVEYDFTANLEEQLDDISGGAHQRGKTFCKRFLALPSTDCHVGGAKDLTITQVIDALDADLGPHFFPSGDRSCPTCKDGSH
jgi:DNA topoisomerase-1